MKLVAAITEIYSIFTAKLKLHKFQSDKEIYRLEGALFVKCQWQNHERSDFDTNMAGHVLEYVNFYGSLCILEVMSNIWWAEIEMFALWKTPDERSTNLPIIDPVL